MAMMAAGFVIINERKVGDGRAWWEWMQGRGGGTVEEGRVERALTVG